MRRHSSCRSNFSLNSDPVNWLCFSFLSPGWKSEPSPAETTSLHFSELRSKEILYSKAVSEDQCVTESTGGRCSHPVCPLLTQTTSFTQTEQTFRAIMKILNRMSWDLQYVSSSCLWSVQVQAHWGGSVLISLMPADSLTSTDRQKQ